MELTGQQHISAARQKVWDALNDPAILARCVPGCERIDKVSDNEMHASVLLKIGPVRARFAGKIVMSDVQAPSSCVLSFEGAGGAAGFARGCSQVTLTEGSDGTALQYTVDASVGGKLGQIGGRLIDSSAKKMADEFFTAFNAVLTDSAAPTPASSLLRGNATARAEQHVGQRAEAPSFTGSFMPELYRAFWFCFGAAFTLALSKWLA